MLNNIKAVLFDFDGTLVDSMSVWEDIDRDFFEKNNFQVDYEEVKKDIEGCSMFETAEYFINNFNLTYTPDELMEIWINMAEDYYLNSIQEKKGASAFIKKLKATGIKVGIGSSNSRALIDAGLKAHGILNDIDVVVTAHDVNASKPAPDVYLKAAELLEVDPCNCIVFEDVMAGVEAGKNAKMRTCVIFDNYSKLDWEEKKNFADYSINDYTEVLGFINE